MKKLLIILVLLSLAITAQYFYDQQGKAFKASAEYQPLVGNTTTYDNFNLGLKPALADYFWLAAIQYYGGWRDDHNYSKLADYLKLSTDLDPKFSYPYAFAALLLPSEGISEGYTIAEKGIEQNLNDWQIPYYLATSYHISAGDKTKAAYYFDLAARTQGAPSNLKFISAAYNSAPDNRQTAEAIWQAVFENSKDSSAIDRAHQYLVHYQIMDFYDQAAATYQQKIGSWPKTPEDLISGKILNSLPTDPFGFTFKFTDQGKVQLKSTPN